MERHPLRTACALLVLVAGPAAAAEGARAKSGDRAAQEKAAHEKAADKSPPVIGCPSLANYRMLVRAGSAGAAATLADPKADHLGCTALPRGRITGVADHVVLGGQAYECAAVQGTTACHWMEAGTRPAPTGRPAVAR
ncbi:hypothetical protein Q8W71_12115 [Methylobacterium sp. NEAU 140]|uniref:hypothetical protein n=1 Tax=Methylobacterium sp. NEAU 140 TaxID=3064945 RepID=UPI002734A0FD|nr:hypothetical protein [Methylobacterium sp. NEAU 140]MDP4023374.1 hypothetical protein [Methylobacterium sp. NEAU 140]